MSRLPTRAARGRLPGDGSRDPRGFAGWCSAFPCQTCVRLTCSELGSPSIPCLADPTLDGTETGHIGDEERHGGGRGGGHLPPADGHTSPPEPRSQAGRRSRVKNECPGSRDAEPTRANPFVLEARTAAACSPSASGVTATTGQGSSVPRRPAPAGRGRLQPDLFRAREPGRVAATCDVCLGLVGELGG
jgi:hypothetical protein